MRTTTRTIALFVALACATAPAVAQGQKPAKPVRDELVGDARNKFDAGKNAYDAKLWDVAMAQFTEAYDLSKNPRLLLYIGLCQRNLARHATAMDTFKRELKEGGDKLSKQEVTDLNTLINGLDQFVSTADIKVNESGAKIVVNSPGPGAPIDITKAAGEGPVPIEVGTRTFTATKDKFDDATVTVLVKRGEPAKIELKLVPKQRKALVTLEVEGGAGATVFIDDMDMGPGPFKGEVNVGTHRFTVKSPGFKDSTKTAEVEEGKPLNLHMNLAVDRKEAGIVINVTPVAGTIELDGKPLGNTTHYEGPVKTGRHIIEVKKTGYVTSRHEIFVGDDETRDVNAKLDREKDTSWVPWTIGTVVLVGGATALAFAVFRPGDQQPVIGNLEPGKVNTVRFGWH